jgi:hypothetical protein
MTTAMNSGTGRDVDDVEGSTAAGCEILTADQDRWRAFSNAAWSTALGHTWYDAAVMFEKALELAVARAARGEVSGGRLSQSG